MSGKKANLSASLLDMLDSVATVEPKIIAAIISAATDSKTSADEPTQSPT